MKILSLLASSLLIISHCPAYDGGNLQKPSLRFTENKGQITDQFYAERKDIDFKVADNSVSVFVGKGQLHYQWVKSNAPVVREKFELSAEPMRTEQTEVTFYRMDVTLLGANTNAKIIADSMQADYDRYYNGSGGNDGILAYSYQKITYQNIYPNIDWVLYTKDNALKYDFVVHPDGNVRDIKLQYGGATDLAIANGSLTATTPFGSITDAAPYTYEAGNGKSVSTQFSVDGNTVSFNVAPYKGTIVIDPAISWSTYYGGANNDDAMSVTGDKSGSIYIAGNTLSTSNIATAGAYQTTASFGSDGFIAKFNTQGQRLWGTYYGGTQDEFVNASTCDKNGNIYITGYCKNSTSIITTGAHQSTYGGGTYDAFLAKFNSSGQIVWGTFYGGGGEDDGFAITCDSAANIYMTGYSYSANNISTLGSHQATLGGQRDAYIVKFNTNGIRQWGTYYGGMYSDRGMGIICDSFNNLYCTGFAFSDQGISSLGSYQASRTSTLADDAFLVKFNSAGIRQWGTYFGGTESDYSRCVVLDKYGNIYIGGDTHSADVIGSPSSHQGTHSGISSDCFIAKFNNGGNKIWSTYYGGGDREEIYSLSTDDGDKLYLGGVTFSSDNIATVGSHKSTLTAGRDGFFAIFNLDGQRSYGSYFGGPNLNDNEEIHGIHAWDGNLYICGGTISTTGIATSGSHQTILQGGSDGFLTKFAADSLVSLTSLSATSACPGSNINLSFTTNLAFQSNNVFTAQLSDANGSFYKPMNIATLNSNTSGMLTATVPMNLPNGSGYKIRVASNAPFYVSNALGLNISYNIPSVNLLVSPGTSVGPGRQVTFTASPTNGGSNPAYQWRENGIDIPGANGAAYTVIAGTDFMTGDGISLKMASNDPCTKPDTAVSNVYTMDVNLGVNDVQTNTVTLYPNPAQDVLEVRTGIAYATNYRILNTLGQSMQTGTLQPNSSTIDVSKLTPGSYYIRLTNEQQGVAITKQFVKE